MTELSYSMSYTVNYKHTITAYPFLKVHFHQFFWFKLIGL
jgi:hypothetical protein